MSILRNFTVRTRLFGLGGLALVMATLLGITGLWCISRAAEGTREVARSNEAMRHHLEGDMMHDALRGDVLASLLAANDTEREEVRVAYAEHAEWFRETIRMNRELGLEGNLAQAIADVGPTLEAYIASAGTTIDLAFADAAAGRAALPEFMTAFSHLEERMEGLSDLIEGFSNATAEDAAALEAFAQRTMLAIWLSASGVLLAAAWAISRSITGPVRDMRARLEDIATGDGDLTKRLAVEGQDEMAALSGLFNAFLDNLNTLLSAVRQSAEQLNNEVQSVTEGANSISAGAQSQAASLQQTAASLEEITSTVQGNADNSERAAKLVDSAKRTAGDGESVVESAVVAMQTLDASSSRISAIVSIIDTIAFQTNLLALNAAVEAARAGDQGRGFAVVASEVRSLAQRSAEAAREIKTLIDDSVDKVGRGTDLVQRSGTTLHEISDSVQRVSTMMSEIAAASREQSTGIQQIHKAVSQMDGVVQQNSSRTEELSAASETMAQEAQRMLSLVARFKLSAGAAQPHVARAHKPNPKAPLRASNSPRQATVSATSRDSEWS